MRRTDSVSPRRPPARAHTDTATPLDHTIGSPLALASDTYSAKAWTKYADIPAVQHAAVRTVQGSVTHLDCATKTATIVDARGHSSTVRYDYAICCSGLRREHPTVPQSLFRDKYLAECKEHIDSVRDATESIVIIGGGTSPPSFRNKIH